LICVGSTAFTVISMSPPLAQHEPARIAAQIVTGVGFLGAGAILHEPHGVRGLTTAATAWVTAAVGIVIGAGYAAGGFALSLMILLTLAIVRRIGYVLSRFERQRVLIVFRPEHGKTLPRLRFAIDETAGPEIQVDPPALLPDGRTVLPIVCLSDYREHRALLAALADDPAVEELRVDAG
jgi:uncharacterized membrane protein YhiD involved in acid resistance